MHLDHLLLNSRLGSLALALALVLAAPAARALDLVPVASSAAAATLSAPPAFPDSAHIPNGCHLSTVTFLAKFLAQYPQESGEPLVIAMHNDSGVRWNHTIAVISWHGQTWCRDEYFGVFALDCSFDQKPATNRLAIKAESALGRHVRTVLHSSEKNPLVPPPDVLSPEQRIQDVTVAAQMVPFQTTIYWVRSGKHEVPVAFFRPSAKQIAVYEPLHGTCLAECSIHDDAKVVSLVAAKLGYSAENVRAELPTVKSALVVADSSSQ
jgi:hypothetical protein